ncbi:hypothetical protein FACS1894141_7040 [Spirochaetia bacterium]|nr:hypothetical protein FACS1894141_7040 [Spirochaetia bacterium]
MEIESLPVPNVPSDDPAIVPSSRLKEAWWQERHNEKTGAIIKNQKIILIGDSITQLWEETRITMDNYHVNLDSGQIASWKALNIRYNNRITNLGFSGDRVQHVLWRLLNGEFPAGINPEYAVLLIGTNNSASGHSPESIAAGIGMIIKIIHANSPATKIMLFAILPRGDDNSDKNRINNNAVNKIIKKYDGLLGVNYFDIGQCYVKDDGILKNELFVDKTHLTSAGYNVWKEKLLEIMSVVQ